MSRRIESIHADEILDSRGNPTVRVTVALKDGSHGTASVPSGASTGSHEAWELRDGDARRFGGKGVRKAVRHVEQELAEVVVGMDAGKQQQIDARMCVADGTVNKRRLGANAILGVSLAVAHAHARSKKVPLYRSLRQTFGIPEEAFRLPIPTMNVLNGGAHAGWVCDIQEAMVVPRQRTFAARVRAGAEVFQALKHILSERHLSTLVGDEGGFAVAFPRPEDAFGYLIDAIEEAGYEPGEEVGIAADVAASEFYDADSKLYQWKGEKKNLTADQMVARMGRWVKQYPFVSIEDGLAEDDWEGWASLTSVLGERMTLVGDDLFVTNKLRLQQGIDTKVGNAILIKVNQIGTLSETMETIALAQAAGYKVSISHRSGETADTTIADLAVAVNADFLKSGSLSRSERVEKYNRVMEIEEELNK
ncbi:phosphopyruvate hydratase [Candidatus Uhrbacteria bacterium]|nr:phosphopyruvate hydratase [Candidatus Uhrbacteria bacterium]